MPEEEQEIGRVGAKRAKRLLEATLRFKLPYNAYENPERVELVMLTGRVESYDLNGDHLDDRAQAITRVFVESKNVDGAGSQASEFQKFLAQAYSATKQAIEEAGRDPLWEFMWATICPWKGEGFTKVAWPESVLDAVRAHVGSDSDLIPADHEIDEELVRTIAKRIWVWVISNRQEEMTINARVRALVRAQLEEEAA